MSANRIGTRRASRRGFTLLEILLVVGLLALLASFAIPALVGQGEEAKKKLAAAAIGSNGTLAQPINLFKFSVNRYPETMRELLEKPSDEQDAEKWTGPYLENESGLKDPWGNEFQYRQEGQHNEGKYDLWSLGPDGRDGTDDDIVNWKTDK